MLREESGGRRPKPAPLGRAAWAQAFPPSTQEAETLAVSAPDGGRQAKAWGSVAW